MRVEDDLIDRLDIIPLKRLKPEWLGQMRGVDECKILTWIKCQHGSEWRAEVKSLFRVIQQRKLTG